MAKKEAFLQFLKAARSLQDRGLSKEAIVQFAKNEFGELSELFKKQIDSLFKPKKGIENIKLKDEVFDDTVVKMQFDDSGVPFNPKNPLKTKSLTYEEAIAREEAKAAADEDYIMKIFDPEDFAKGGRAGYAVGNQVTPQVDARMNVDYNTLVDQNTAQRGTQAKARNKVFNVFMTPQGNVAKDQGIAQLARDTGKAPKIQNYAINSGTDIARMIGPGTGIGVGNQSYGGGQQFSNLGFAALPSSGQTNTTTNQQYAQDMANKEAQTAKANAAFSEKEKQSQAFGKMIEQKYLDAYGRGATSMDEFMSGKNYAAEAATLGMNPLAYMDYFLTSDPQNIYEQYRKQDPYYDAAAEAQYAADPSNPETPELGVGPLDVYYQQQLQNQIKQGIPEAERIQRGQVLGMPGATSSMYESYEDALARTRTAMGLASGGRAGHYTGGIVDVEPSLDDIGHGSDALMARTRLVAPDSQATTSTGLNYLLAEDNDNMRVPFADGNGVADEDAEKAALGKRVRELMDEGFDMGEAVKKAMSEGYAKGGRIGYNKGKAVKAVVDKGRRGFMKAAGAAGAGIAALKTGLLGFGKEAAPVVEKAAETVSNTMGEAPAYFLNLIKKIKNLGSEYSPKYSGGREKITNYKDYTLTEDLTTGETTIQRFKQSEVDYYDEMLMEENYMNYRPGMADETTKGKTPPGEYTEDTGYLRTSGPSKGDLVIEGEPIPKDIIEEGTMFEDNMTEFGKTKKASGGIARMIGE